MTSRIVTLVTIFAMTSNVLAAEGDWPQWRFDANRSGATEHELPDQLNLIWHRDLGAPEPAFEHQARICADASYAPVSADGLAFVPSNISDSMTAYELATGKRKWRFVCEGPVRFAGVARDGRIVFGSDDGYLYCLNAYDGTLVWKVRGAPESHPESRLLVNGRLSSRWAVRGAPVLHDGVIYFGAGVWSEEGVYVVAISVDSGEVLWRTDAMSSVTNGMSDHGKAYDIGLPPHGYPAVIDDKLLMPSGRSPAAFFDLKTGEMEPYTTMYVKFYAPRGYWYASGIGQYWFQGGNILGTSASMLGELPPDKMPLAEFTKSFGFTERELRRARAKRSVPPKVVDENGESSVIFKFSDPFSAGMSPPRQLLDNDRYFVRNRPLFRVDPVQRANMHAETGLFSEPVWTEDTLYWSEFADPAEHVVHRGDTYPHYPRYDYIVARDLNNTRWTVTKGDYLRERKFAVKWRLKAPYKVMIKAGSLLYGGIENEVAAIQIPGKGEPPAVVWKAQVDGIPINILAARGRLLVVTDKGHFYCFGRADERAVKYNRPRAVTRQEKRWGEIAHVAGSGREAAGYALVLGYNSGVLARSFAAQEGWQVIVLENDAQEAADARSELAADGLYGKHLQVVVGLPKTLHLTAQWADAVVSEDLSAFRRELPSVFGLVKDVLRPFSGVALLPIERDERAVLSDACREDQNYCVDEVGGMTRVRRIAALPGAADWTHEAGNASNTYASSDALVRAPLRLLWLSGQIDRIGTPEFEYQHSRGPFPLYWKGRIFYIASNVIHSADMYTGRYLWRYELPETKKTEALKWVHRPFSRPDDDNFLILDGRLYLVSDENCHVVDAASGRQIKILTIPEELREKDVFGWNELRGEGGKLFAVFGRTLACIEPQSSEVFWTHVSAMKNVTFAIGAGEVFCVDYDAPPQFGGTKTSRQAALYALAIDSGRELWRQSLTIPPLSKYTVPGVQGGAINWVAPIKPLVAYNAKHDVLLAVVNRAMWTAYRGSTGKSLWQERIKWPAIRIHHLEPPTILGDYVIPHRQDYSVIGSAFDVRTGRTVDLGNIVPSKRGCSRIVGNDYLLTYRDAATAIYDLEGRKILRNNSIRSGCTNGMVPAGGILNAPNFANGCVCNYPVFASYALYHAASLPSIPSFYTGQ